MPKTPMRTLTEQLRAALAAGGAVLFSTALPGAAAQTPDAPVSGPPVFADDAAARGLTPEAQQGYDIAARSDRSDHGFGDSRVEARMVLRSAAGQTTERNLSFLTLEKEDESVGDKSLVIFNSPRDVAGTALLSHAKILDPDNQWLYLPALKRVKRISSANKSGPFVGSEFAFEDFTITELNKFTYAYAGEEALDGITADVLERFPRYERSGYAKQRIWIDQEIRQPRKLEFYDRRGALLKTLTISDYRNYDGVWRGHRLEMVNHQTGKETDLLYADYAFDTGLDEGDFVRGVLQRIR